MRQHRKTETAVGTRGCSVVDGSKSDTTSHHAVSTDTEGVTLTAPLTTPLILHLSQCPSIHLTLFTTPLTEVLPNVHYSHFTKHLPLFTDLATRSSS